MQYITVHCNCNISVQVLTSNTHAAAEACHAGWIRCITSRTRIGSIYGHLRIGYCSACTHCTAYIHPCAFAAYNKAARHACVASYRPITAWSTDPAVQMARLSVTTWRTNCMMVSAESTSAMHSEGPSHSAERPQWRGAWSDWES